MKTIIFLLTILLVGCDGKSKWMTSRELAIGENFNTPEEKAFLAAFDEDNGTIYCVPKMTNAKLGEFRSSLPALMIRNFFDDKPLSNADKFDINKPIQSSLRLALSESYPCSK